MNSISVHEILMLLSLFTGMLGSYFMLRAKVMVLEERMERYHVSVRYLFKILSRIEEKLQKKADK